MDFETELEAPADDLPIMTPEQAQAAGAVIDDDTLPEDAQPVEAQDADLPVMTPEQARAAGAVEDEDLPVMSPEEARAAGAVDDLASGRLGTLARAGTRGAITTAGSLPAIGAGAALGGVVAGPVGAIAGGVVGAIGGGYLMEKIQDEVLEALGWDKGTGFFSKAQRAADTEQHPYYELAGTLAGAAPAFGTGVGKGVTALQRVAGAGILGGLEVGSELYEKGTVDPVKAGMAALTGAALPTARPWAARAMAAPEAAFNKFRPGRPDTAAPTAPAEKATVDVVQDTTSPAASTAAEHAPPVPKPGIGNVENPPIRDEGNKGKYSKTTIEVTTPEGVKTTSTKIVESAAMHPDVKAAMDALAGDTKIDTGIVRPEDVASPSTPEAPRPQRAKPAEPAAATQVPEPAAPRPVDPNAPVWGAEPTTRTYLHPDIEGVRIDRSGARLGEGITPDGKTMIIPESLPGLIDVAGKPLDPAYPLTVREVMRKRIADQIAEGEKIGGPKVPADERQKIAYRAGELAQEKWLTERGYDVNAYRAALRNASMPGGGSKGKVGELPDRPAPAAGSVPERARAAIARSKAAGAKQQVAPAAEAPAVPVAPPARKSKMVFTGKDAGMRVPEPIVTPKAPIVTAKPGVQDKLAAIKAQRVAEGKPEVAPTKIVADTVKRLRERGLEEQAKAIEAMPLDQQIQTAARASAAMTNKTGTLKAPGKPLANPRIRNPEVIAELEIDGLGVMARTKADAAKKTKSIEAIEKAYTETPPPPAGAETRDELRARLMKMLGRATTLNEGKDPVTAYKPMEPPASWSLLREAQRLVKGKMTEKQINDFIVAEKLIRGGKGSYDVYRQGKKTEGDIARNQRTGDTVVAAAETAKAREFPSTERVTPEEAEAWTKPEPVIPEPGMLPDKAPVGGEIGESMERLAVLMKEAKRKGVLPEAPAKKSEVANPEDVFGSNEVTLETKPAKPQWEVDAAKAEAKIARLKAARESKGQPEPKKEHAEIEGLAEPEPAPRSLVAMFKDESGAITPQAMKAVGDWIKSKAPKAYPETNKVDFAARNPKSAVETKARKLDEDLHTLEMRVVSSKIALAQEAEKAPAWSRTKAVQEQLYKAIESGTEASLPTKYREVLDKHIRPMMDKAEQLYANIAKIDPALLAGRGYIHRIAHGDATTHRVSGSTGDPLEMRTRSLSPFASSLQDRVFMALEGPNGKRIIISPAEDGFTAWYKGKSGRVDAPGFKVEEGSVWKDKNGVKMTVKRALTDEIEANGRFKNGEMAKYVKNAGLSASTNLQELSEIAQHLQFLETLKADPMFTKYATKDKATAVERGWEKSKMPQFQQYYMDRHLKYVFDDYVGLDSLNGFRNFSQRVVQAIFINPVPHAANVFVHWWVGRGWDWITPQGYRSLAQDGTKAILSVLRQDPLQRTLRDAGMSDVYGSVITKNFMQDMAKIFDADVKKNPSKWDPIARTLGMGPSDLVRSVYGASSRMMWSVNTMLATQRMLELTRKGMSMEHAIRDMERHLPNYRIPATILGSGQGARLMSRVMQDQALSAFGRYHYAVFNSFAHMAKDLAVGNAKEKFDAVGNLMALGLFAFLAKPALDAGWQALTGNKKAEAYPRGPMAPLSHAWKALQGKADIGQLTRGIVTMTPATATALDFVRNRNFADKPIVGRGDLKKVIPKSTSAEDLAKSARYTGKVGIEIGEHALRGLVAPYNTFVANPLNRKQPPLEAVRDAFLDIKNPSPAANKFMGQLPQVIKREDRARAKKPHGPLESLYNKSTR